MSIEQNYQSEDSSKEFDELKKHENIDQLLSGIAAAPEEFSVEDALNTYTEKARFLHRQLVDISRYINAKENVDTVRSQIDKMALGEIPSPGTSLQEKMAVLKKYEAIIKFYEEAGVPKEMLAAARETTDELQKDLNTLSKISNIARYRPQQN